MLLNSSSQRSRYLFSNHLWMCFFACLLFCAKTAAQTPASTDSQILQSTASTTQTVTPETLQTNNQTDKPSFFGLQSQLFAGDIARQITDFILPVTIGDYVLHTLHYETIKPTVKGHVLFITAGFGNSSQMLKYQALSQVFVDAGYNTMIATLPIGDALPNTLAEASDYWAESLNGIIDAVDNTSPYSVVYASGPIAATLLTLYDEQRLPMPTALVIQDVFFATHAENQKLPALIGRFPNALLDLSHPRANRWADATLKTRRQTIHAQSVRHKVQRQLIGMTINDKQRHLIYKEMTGWFKRIGWQ